MVVMKFFIAFVEVWICMWILYLFLYRGGCMCTCTSLNFKSEETLHLAGCIIKQIWKLCLQKLGTCTHSLWWNNMN